MTGKFLFTCVWSVSLFFFLYLFSSLKWRTGFSVICLQHFILVSWPCFSEILVHLLLCFCGFGLEECACFVCFLFILIYLWIIMIQKESSWLASNNSESCVIAEKKNPESQVEAFLKLQENDEIIGCFLTLFPFSFFVCCKEHTVFFGLFDLVAVKNIERGRDRIRDGSVWCGWASCHVRDIKGCWHGK